jgi:aspartyl-tRNA(Asn)/glutamyl-tRNA(Gln) amidotransferase subunit A
VVRVFGLKPSNGRIPIDPPYIGRVAGPMTRTVTDAALMMTMLSRPDPRDYMDLPYQDLPWLDLNADVAGLRIGLMMDAGCGSAPSQRLSRPLRRRRICLKKAAQLSSPSNPL